jgi:DNA processing protein
MQSSLLYNIAITFIKDIGDIRAKNLLAYCGSAESVFSEKKQSLCKIPGIGDLLAEAIINNKADALASAEKELTFIEKNEISPLFFTDGKYPARLKQCADSPLLLYFKGNADLNQQKIISIVGARNQTEYGERMTNTIVKELAAHDVLIVSGLAYGVDITAHRAALDNGLKTIGVMAHGLDRIYPSVHTQTADKMVNQGGLLSDFPSETNPDRENFPKRNRIVAGLCDAVIVIESKKDGGSLITADIANSYNRDVFAVPGTIDMPYSKGCNHYIKINKAALLETAADIAYILGWEAESNKKNKTSQVSLPLNLTIEEEKLFSFIKEKGKVNIDELAVIAEMPMSKASALLLNMEFSGYIKSLPGKIYQLA